nr:MAG TPA: hypothetical protein [Caudoviricetes sp.]
MYSPTLSHNSEGKFLVKYIYEYLYVSIFCIRQSLRTLSSRQMGARLSALAVLPN